MSRGRPASLLPFAALGLLAAALRTLQFHHALVYPDGYQYLLMARGIAEHGRPITRLGPGGDLFVPNPDAALKPLFPLLVAMLHLGGLSLRAAGEVVTVLAEATVVVLTGALARRLTRSALAAVVASALCLASPGLAFWSGFAGPDSLASALALAAALALVSRRYATGGVLAGLCVAARPEYALLAVVAGAVAISRRDSRTAAVPAIAAAAAAVGSVLVLTRPPLVHPSSRLLVEAAAAAILTAILVGVALRQPRLVAPTGLLATGAAVGLGAAAWEARVGSPSLLETDWPLTIGIAGLLLALLVPSLRAGACCLAASAALLGSAYYAKNPELPRYAAQLLPLLALGSALGTAAVVRSQRSVLASTIVPAAAVAALVLTPQPRPGPDPFAAIAGQLDNHSTRPLLTAAPDAYGLLLAPRPVASLAAGRRGLALLDAAQRTYEPKLDARGAEVARLTSTGFLLRAGAPVDRRPALLISGRVVMRGR